MPRHMQQTFIANLSAHLGITRCAIENQVQLISFFAGQNRFDNRLGLKKIVTEKFRWFEF